VNCLQGQLGHVHPRISRHRYRNRSGGLTVVLLGDSVVSKDRIRHAPYPPIPLKLQNYYKPASQSLLAWNLLLFPEPQ